MHFHFFEVRNDEETYITQILQVAALAAWNMRDMSSPSSCPRLFCRFLEPNLDDEGVRVRFDGSGLGVFTAGLHDRLEGLQLESLQAK